MKHKDVRYVLARMVDCATSAISYVDGMSKEDFLADTRTQSAVNMNLLIMGELAATLRRSFAEDLKNLPPLPFEKMIGMRNRIAHGYFDLNLNAVWEVVSVSLPELRSALTQIGITGVDGLEPLKRDP
jgi:uncharacterized protein with HEPN domain